MSETRTVARWRLVGTALCWALCAFDLGLGSVALIWPEQYLALFHPDLATPQVELLRRTGVLWLVFSGVALRAATAAPARQSTWLLLLAVLRLMEVPADIVYAVTATGMGSLGRILLWSAPPINLALGIGLYVLSRRLATPGRA